MQIIFDDFDAPSGIWTNETGSAWNGNPSYNASRMTMNPPNLSLGRFISVFEVSGDLNIEISGNRAWEFPSNYNGSNARGWVGIYQSGAATQFTSDPDPNGYGKSHKLWVGIPSNRQSFMFDTCTHYTCDLNELFDWENNWVGSRDFSLRFIRNNDNIEIYNKVGGDFTLWRTFTIENPSSQLFFEFVEMDWSSFGHSYTNYEFFDYSINVDTPSEDPPSQGSNELGRPLDWLIKSQDYYPQILGTLAGASGVNIQLWQVVNGQNTSVPVASSGCYQIGDTTRWGWSTENLSNDSLSQQQYFYLMTSSNNSENFGGQFFFALSEDAKWMHPNNMSTYLL